MSSTWVGSRRDYDIKHHDALEQSDGSYLNSYGDITWYNEAGKYHRADGPAVLYADGVIYSGSGAVGWYIDGLPMTFRKWLTKSTASDEHKMMLRLQYA
jgi:hypothetical protein